VQVTGVEVVRKNPVVLGVPVEVPAGEGLELTYGQTLRVGVALEYRGSRQRVTLYGAIGNRGLFGFDEVIHGEADLDLPESLTEFTPVMGSVNIPITADIDPGTDYDLYCKIKEYPAAGMPEVDNVIDIVGMPPTYELIQETIYPYAYVYDGDVEQVTFTFTSDPFTPADWNAERFAQAAAEEVEKQGGRLLELRVYVDKTPLLWTDWRIEIMAVPPPEEGVGFAWSAVILAILAIVAIVVLTWAITTIAATFQHRALSEEIKLTWSRETLIGVIGDFEEKLERTPTPAEELEQMSDQDLRDYANQLAQAVAPPGAPWWPLAIGAGVVVLGIGAATAARRRRE